MRRLRLQVRRLGPHFRTVLVSGEAGTEKESVARALHGMCQQAKAAFVARKAATFEGALAEYDGTLFLDEINEMPLHAQGRLLDVLKKHELVQSHLGASQRTDLWIIASTSEDLKILVATGSFRQELYQRLATVAITVPPLRERIEDLAELVRYFLGRFALLYSRTFHDVPEDAMGQLRRYRWPGNVRELESVLRDGALRSQDGSIEFYPRPRCAEQNRLEPSVANASKSLRLQAVVEQHVRRVLKESGGNKLRAAEVLGISRSTLYRMLDTGASAR
jgi:transcriptional regulator with PAS, ATPase and Fis domain